MDHPGGVRSVEFFRARLLNTQTFEDVQGLIAEYTAAQNELIAHITQIMWHMRGGVTRDEAWALSPDERRAIMRLIDERVKLVEKTGLPIL